MLLIIEQITRLYSFMFLCAEIQYKSFTGSDPKPIWFCGLWIRLAASNSPHTSNETAAGKAGNHREILHHSFRTLGPRKENIRVLISCLVGVFSPGAEPVPWLASWQRICLMYCQEGQGGTRAAHGECNFWLFLSGNHPEDDPSSCLLIPVSGRKEAETPELCESQGACEGAWGGRVLGSTVIMSSFRQRSWLRLQPQGHTRRMEPTLCSLRRTHSHCRGPHCAAEIGPATLICAATFSSKNP